MANQQDWNKDDMNKQGSDKNEGNFKNDPERAAREGKKGGESKGKRGY